MDWPTIDGEEVELDINSLFFWWPRLRDERMPKTVGVIFDIEDAFPLLDGDPALNLPWMTFRGAAETVGFPVFVRSDISSAKHSGPKAYRMDSLEDTGKIIAATLMDNCLKNLEGKMLGFVFRQWIDLAGRFTAFNGHIIAPEVRIFPVDPKEGIFPDIEASYFYWPEEAFERQGDRIDHSWRELRDEMEHETMVPEILGPLEERALAAVENIGFGSWSVDFALDKNGDWWLIDMALAKNSWRPKKT